MDKAQEALHTKIKVIVIMVLAGIIGIGYFLNPEAVKTILYLSISGDIDGTVEFLRSFGVWAMIISFIIDILINIVGFLPSVFISTANGVLFGVIPGIIISWLAETIGVILSFFLFRTILRDSAEELIKKSNMLKKIDDFSGTNGFKMMLFARTLPYFPSGIITALGAISHISAKDYILANLIGKFPSTALEVIVGHDIVNYEQNLSRLTAVVLSVTLAYGVFWWYAKRGQKSRIIPTKQEKET